MPNFTKKLINLRVMKKAIKISAIAVLVLAVVSFAAGWYMVNFALQPEDHGQDLERYSQKWNERVPGIIDWYDSLHVAGIFKDMVILGSRDRKLHAVYAAAPAPAAGTAVLVHGYTDNHLCMMHIARIYRDSLGFNVLLPDNSHHGLSEGEAVQMGWLDRLDVKQWLGIANGIFGDDFTIVHGVSMGGATTMMLSGEPDLPAYVKGFVDDCGYTTVWNQFKKELREDYSLPAFPVLYAADLVCRMRFGWSFQEASSLDQLAKCERPMLFIHGDSDKYVPTADVYLNFDAKQKGYKELWIVPDTAHARSCENHPAEYAARLHAFVEKIKSGETGE